ncbi:radical SAM protein [Streptomyces sp. MMG1533]|uniref:HEXXH motif domain-containing protein n=1 Tax=Streptomyces sp. MMG1533 TaxID=1415546 RepID=UPI0006ADDDDF|nr:HEXXH motif domain-containing protein [Streptomyces sp. MMG1533]KOU62400.1 radical SAM protein [Streptomyces sp. MMG1533]
MSSEQRPAPFRMPERLFAELAAGGGSAAAVAFLERGERARRLLLLRTLLDRLATLPTPLTPATEAWHVLKEAATRAHDPVERLLLAPATGGWLAHVLRRAHGTASGPPLWADAGHLCALAVTASLHAGTDAELRVPLVDGALTLPGLGLARLPDAEGGLTVGLARTSGGELTLAGPGRHGVTTSVTIRPGTAGSGNGPGSESGSEGAGYGSAAASWLPLRTLTHPAPTGTVAIPLDDLDPYRDLDDPLPPARLDAAETKAWQRVFEGAVTVLAVPGGVGPGRLDPAWIRSVVPWGRTSTDPPAPPTVQVSASSGDSFGAMVIARPSSALALAETLVHEFQHSKLAALLHLFPLLDDDREERYYAPWRPDPRHLTGLLHGAYAFTGVAGFWRDRLAVARDGRTGGEDSEIAPPDDRAAVEEEAGYHFALRRLQSRLVVRTLLAEGRLTPQGRALVSGLARTLDGWLREPVPASALARARTAAALHRTEWRLRNVAPTDDAAYPAATRFRLDRASWPDLRTHAFATRPTVPHTADEHLAAGDPGAALARYADELAADPAEPHALAGWIVARATLDPGRTARRMLARPELLQPQPSG